MEKRVQKTVYLTEKNNEKINEIYESNSYFKTTSDALNYVIGNFNMDNPDQSEIEAKLDTIISKLGYIDKNASIGLQIVAGMSDNQENFHFQSIDSIPGSLSYERAKKFVEEAIQKNVTKKSSSDY